MWTCLSLVSCMGTAPGREVQLVDSLNQLAYAFRYKDLDSSFQAASGAYREANLYRSGKAEACNHLGFCALIRMDFEQAVKCHREVYDLTKNELELLIADIGLMKVYQRTALNKEFYDYRNSALRRMKRIAEEDELFADRHERARLSYARSEFYIVSAVYYYYLQQRPEAIACMDAIAGPDELAADTNQLLYYHYIKGASALCGGDTPEEQHLKEFDELYATWRMASRQGYLYFEGNGVQGLANLMASAENYQLFLHRRPHALTQLGVPVDSLLPMRLGQLALRKFRRYDDLYQIAGAYVSIGKYLNAHGRYEEALDSLKVALECVNDHHRRFYDCHDSLDWLKVCDTRGVPYVERKWMEQRLKTVPEWISRIREQLSVSYAGLGMKEQSDYNRNIYLDILEDTRQDKELESRYQALERESGQLNALLCLVAAGLVLTLLFFGLFSRWSKRKNRLHLHRLHLLLHICRQVVAAIPADAQEEDEIVEAIRTAIEEEVKELFGIDDCRIADRRLLLPSHIGKDEQAMVKVINPYIEWALDNGLASISLNDERKKLEKQRYVYEQHIAANKRQNLMKKTCLAIVNGIHPYIDRIAHEVGKFSDKKLDMDETRKQEKYQYMDELVTVINEYNDILALWIKMKQGSLSLNIETFPLNELFDLLRKSNRAFEMKHRRLEIVPTDLLVKADRALTFFMINTLAENARKYTQPGGMVKVYAHRETDYVEISVEDNGCGLSPEDMERIVGEKVYDSKDIGMNDARDREELRKAKGSGFGLMNCKGIIEKYRKTNALFRVCLFSVESTIGKGSRFYFRIPAGVHRLPMLLLPCFLGLISACGPSGQKAAEGSVAVPDSLRVQERGYETLLDSASAYADRAYYANIAGEYEESLCCADSAIAYLNAHYRKYADSSCRPMELTGKGEPAELGWWNGTFNSDFHVILDIRNEAAVAFLALKRWEEYSYNNAAYTTLFKLLGEDQSLEEYCRQLERSSSDKLVSMWLGVMLLLIFMLGYYILYVRKRLQNRWNLEQVLEVNKQFFSASLASAMEEGKLWGEEEMLKEIPSRMVRAAFDAINELIGIDRMGIAVYDEEANGLEYAFEPVKAEDKHLSTLRELMADCFETRSHLNREGVLALPLVVEAGGSSRCIGVFCLEQSRAGEGQESDSLLMELVARYVAIVIFNAVVKLTTKYRDIEVAQDEAHRASWEDSQLHVQNLVLDNCLSTIKHETIYYPNKIKLLVGKLRSGQLDSEAEHETIVAIGELVEYYKGIFTILSTCASRQLEEVTFRRTVIPVSDLMNAAGKYYAKAVKGQEGSLQLDVATPPDACSVVGDANLLRFLFENLIDEAISIPMAGKLSLRAVAEPDYVCFLFTDGRRDLSQEALHGLFYPSLSRMTIDEKGKLRGTEYLVCKQIIRDHDEFAGRRGCRINAEPAAGGGYTVCFTIPRRR